MKFSRLISGLSIAGIIAAASPAPSLAEGVRAGLLECDVAGGMGYILGSSRKVDCTYSPAKGSDRQRYTGEIKKFGLDIGYLDKGKIMWAVFAPNWDVPQGALAGDYVGGTASAAAGYGAGANALIGGGNKSFALQPVSVEGQKGINIAAGIGDLTLRSAK